ncbi:hypothetical protein LZ32DRAFT_610285 [Colletotrichum eremochloae]|nr:hypothetical protein LZ32DRAFT_610285 [Colletotrichum eremochloae]
MRNRHATTPGGLVRRRNAATSRLSPGEPAQPGAVSVNDDDDDADKQTKKTPLLSPRRRSPLGLYQRQYCCGNNTCWFLTVHASHFRQFSSLCSTARCLHQYMSLLILQWLSGAHCMSILKTNLLLKMLATGVEPAEEYLHWYYFCGCPDPRGTLSLSTWDP